MVAVALGVLLGAAWIPLFLFRAENLLASLPYYTAAERYWVRLAPFTLSAHATLGSALVSVTDPLPPSRVLVALLVLAFGVAFWLWGRRQIMPLGERRLPDDRPTVLRRDGAFGLVRNPCYFAYLLVALAPVIAAARPFLAVTWGCGVLVLAVRAVQEERRLYAQLGEEYAQYCAGVKRLIPFVW
ncbi:MAG: isoprenylcysteine carboxylmethyltransferase family protein [Candidatus Binatia bacterium]